MVAYLLRRAAETESMRAGSHWPIWVAVIPLAIWAVVRALGLDRGFPFEAVIAFTPYVAVVAPLVAVLALALQNWAAVAIALLTTICFAAAILPRSIGVTTVGAAGHRTIGVLAANVHEGAASPQGILHLVERLHPDILTIEELTPHLDRELEAAGLGRRLPYRVIDAHRFSSGTGIYSNMPLRRLPTSDFASRMVRAEAVLPGGGKLRIVAVHPYPPNRSTQTGEWEEALATLPSAGRGIPWILAGDFNGTFDQAPFRAVVARGYHDAGEAAGKGLESTFPQTGIWPPPITIDHVLADERLGIVEYGVEPLPGSDHHAIYADLALPGHGAGPTARR
jgi:endonuclease/exonuclease/phosphatase (EEP) superfamily protein YafD